MIGLTLRCLIFLVKESDWAGVWKLVNCIHNCTNVCVEVSVFEPKK